MPTCYIQSPQANFSQEHVKLRRIIINGHPNKMIQQPKTPLPHEYA